MRGQILEAVSPVKMRVGEYSKPTDLSNNGIAAWENRNPPRLYNKESQFTGQLRDLLTPPEQFKIHTHYFHSRI